MEGLSHLVNASLSRHGLNPPLDFRRLQWSKWFRCESSFSLLLAPGNPGVFALGEEMIAPGELASTAGRRMLGVFQISEAEDLAMAMGRLFLPGSPERERFAGGRCFARYAVVEDRVQRRAVHTALQTWLSSAAESASGLPADLPQSVVAAPVGVHQSVAEETVKAIQRPAPLPSGF